jgi:hypothetical protein
MNEGIKCVKAITFDGTEESYYQWRQQILSNAEAYNCKGALLGTIIVPGSTDVLDP